jgi:hypothetical protein
LVSKRRNKVLLTKISVLRLEKKLKENTLSSKKRTVCLFGGLPLGDERRGG